ncbi:hypothetical protein KAR91_54940 [Candidatus Pacearchaeota archaeon]|nr:hypothetical protein [Candidatus Pacearchaeota archaeon]
MSVILATMGKYNDGLGLGGAPPYRRQDEEEHVMPVVFIHNFEMITINAPKDILDKISVKLKD